MNISNSWSKWNQTAVDRLLFDQNGGRIKRIPSEAESINSNVFDQLRDSVTDLSREKCPVQHPLKETSTFEQACPLSPDVQNKSDNLFHDESDDYNSIEDSVVTSHTSGRNKSMGNHPHVMSTMGSNQHRFQDSFNSPMDHHNSCSCGVRHVISPTFSNQHHRLVTHENCNHLSLRHNVLDVITCLQQSSAPHTSQHNPESLPNNGQHLQPQKGYSGQSSDIGLCESLSDIAAPDALGSKHSARINHGRGRMSSASTNLPDDDVHDSIGSDYSFNTIHLSYESRESGPEDRNEGHDRQRNAPANLAKQVSRDDSTPKTASTQPFRTPPLTPTPGGALIGSSQFVKEKIKVFVTYAQEPHIPDHIRTVVQIAQTLLKNSFNVTVDVLEETVRSMSISDWLESNINNSDFVLICISPGYRNVVDSNVSEPYGFNQTENVLNTQYIHRRIHNEYITNGSKNYRFLPVLVSNANVNHIPPWLRDTKAYQWPRDYEDIIYRLFRQERYVKPKPGPPPKHTIERYDSYSSRLSSKGSHKGSRRKQKKGG